MRILLGMSGGLDSTYAAVKLKDLGYEVEGAVLKMHEYSETEAAKEAARSVGIPIHVVDASEAFEKIVVENFISEYKNARTPNPCTICNSEVKFKFLLDYAEKNGFDMIATGHYAKIVKLTDNGERRYAVVRGKDNRKDQSYMLWRLPQGILSKLCFPLADEEKTNVKALAKDMGLTVADRAESQEICFIPSGDYAEFIEKRGCISPPGDFVDDEGNVLGRHNGIIRYTVGQRKGLGISFGQRIFVTDIDPKTNKITLSPNDKLTKEFNISGIVFSGIGEPKIGESIPLSVKVRYAQPPVECIFLYLGGGRAAVTLKTPARAVTPGQSAVLYLDDIVALGGYID